MHKTLSYILLSLLPVLALADDLQQLNKQAGQSVVLLKVYDAAGTELGQGTGFVVAGGVIVTNHHVAEGGSRIDALSGDGKNISILGLLVDDVKNDLALLKPSPHGLQPLPLSTRKTDVGERIWVIGNPLGLSGTLSEGIVSGIRPEGIESDHPRENHTGPLLQISVPISPGSSGSPVLGFDGAVIGVAASTYTSGQNLNFAIPVEMVARLLSESKNGNLVKPLQARDQEKWVILRNLAISAAFFILLLGVLRFSLRGKSGAQDTLN
jgi:S1-C subfamily serine protease